MGANYARIGNLLRDKGVRIAGDQGAAVKSA
jgi:hypothetical protein